MPIKRLVAVLLAVTLAVFFEPAPDAAALNVERVTTMVGTNISTMKRAVFKFVTSHKRPKPRDMVRLQITGLALQAGDELAISLLGDNTVEFGDPTGTDVLVLDAKLRASGQLGTYPNDFVNCRAKFNQKRQRLNLFLKKGTAVRIPVDLASGGGAFKFTKDLTVIVYINGTPFPYSATFEMRMRNRGAGPLMERGKYRNR